MMEDFILQVSIMCLQSEFLDIKLQSLGKLGEFVHKAEFRSLFKYSEKSLYEKFKDTKILNLVFKGHSQLIAKGSEIMKLCLKFDDEEFSCLEMIWNCIKKADYGTKTNIYNSLKDFYSDLTVEQIEY